MEYRSIEIIRQKLEQIRFGILKTNVTSFLQSSRSFIIETTRVTDDGFLLCTTADFFPPDLSGGKSFGVNLNFIQKAEGLFFKITGRAVLINNKSLDNNPIESRTDVGHQEQLSFLKVKIEEAHHYKKKSVSAYTSFLQVINIFTLVLPATKA